MQIAVIPCSVPVRLQIHLEALLQRVPTLDQVISGRCSWDQFGEMVAREPVSKKLKFRVIHENSEKPVVRPEWSTAKTKVHAILPSEDHPRGRIPTCFNNLPGKSTPVLLSDLSLWLAGEMKISVNCARPMVAAMLFAIHQASGNTDALLAS